jgi:glycosyltransferase involved in cell wall biosynthesis
MESLQAPGAREAKVCYLGADPILTSFDGDPRRRCLYGDNVVHLVPTSGADRGNAVDVGPLWQETRSWTGFRVAAPGLVNRVREALRHHPEAALVIGEHHLALPFLLADIPFVFDPTDSNALFYRRRFSDIARQSPRQAANSLRLAVHYTRLERRILAKAACFVTTGLADESFLKGLVPGANVCRIGNGTDLIHQPTVEAADDGRTIGFHGGMTWEPNRKTAEHVAGPIATALARLPGPQLRIRIAGRPVPAALQARDGADGVEICGFVDNIQAWLASLTLYVMPMYLGAGIKNKLIEAMAAGIPVLTNARGAEALPPEGREAIAIAGDDADIARAARTLLAQPGALARMRRAGRAYALRHFDWADHRCDFHTELHRLRAAGIL